MKWKRHKFTLVGVAIGASIGLLFGLLVNAVVLAIFVWALAGLSIGAIFDRRDRLGFY